MFSSQLTPEMIEILQAVDRLALNNAIRRLVIDRNLPAAFCLIMEHMDRVEPETIEVFSTWAELEEFSSAGAPLN